MKILSMFLMALAIFGASTLVYVAVNIEDKRIRPTVIITEHVENGNKCTRTCYTPVTLDFECYSECSDEPMEIPYGN